MLAFAVPQIAQSYSCAPGTNGLVQSQPTEVCTLTAWLTGPLRATVLDITGRRGEVVTLFQSAPEVFINGVAQPQGMGAGHEQVTVPYSEEISAVPAATATCTAGQSSSRSVSHCRT